MNDQHKLGLDLDGNPGGNLFTPTVFTNKNVLAATANGGTASLTLSISDATKLAASRLRSDLHLSHHGQYYPALGWCDRHLSPNAQHSAFSGPPWTA